LEPCRLWKLPCSILRSHFGGTSPPIFVGSPLTCHASKHFFESQTPRLPFLWCFKAKKALS
jgi:hypothetical protein